MSKKIKFKRRKGSKDNKVKEGNNIKFKLNDKRLWINFKIKMMKILFEAFGPLRRERFLSEKYKTKKQKR